MDPEGTLVNSFSAFFEEVEPRLRHALVAALGTEVGVEATADALSYGWENWARLAEMDNPAGYLYRVGRSRARRFRHKPVVLPPVSQGSDLWVETGLPEALARLSERQRVAVVLVHALGWTQAEAAGMLGISHGALRTHTERALTKLRSALGVTGVS